MSANNCIQEVFKPTVAYLETLGFTFNGVANNGGLFFDSPTDDEGLSHVQLFLFKNGANSVSVEVETRGWMAPVLENEEQFVRYLNDVFPLWKLN